MKPKCFILTILLFCVTIFLFSQSNNQNYIRTTVYTKSDNATGLEVIQYFDGLGRLVQTVQKGFTYQGNDLVTLQEYDALGRESNVWLPAPQNASSGNYVTPATIKTSAQIFYDGDTAPFSKPVYEESSLNRVIEQYGPGQEWHNQSNEKSVKTAYKTNSNSLNCIRYTVSGNNLVNSGNYPNNQLYVTETIDEDGNLSYVFTDKLGRTLLTKSSENHDVYYVYDDLNNLRFVLPPIAVNATGNENNTVIKKYAYVYKYDSRNRMIFKKLPGCDSIKYIYDKADRIIFWQDGELRDSSKWMFSIPDVFGRIVLTGICGNSALGKTVNAANFENVIITAKKSTNINSGMYGYDIYLKSTVVQSNGLANMKELNVNFYDNYDFLELNAINNSGASLSYDTQYEDYNKMYGNSSDIVAHKGLLTGSAVAMLESNIMLYSAFYYDYRGRVIQSKSTNHLGGVEKEYIEYDFIGNPLKKLHIHTTAANPNGITEEYVNEYDHAGRLIETKHKLGERNQKTIVVNTYDEAGRLESTTNGETPIINYNYDIRSRLKNIVSTQFAQELFYTFGGNIDEMYWRNKAGDNFDNYFTFEYDNLSRLTDAFHTGNTFASSGLYNEHFRYDKHGNIESLKRYTKRNLISIQVEPSQMDSVAFAHYSSRFSDDDMERGLTSTLADNLTMQYNGNQLTRITEASNHANIASDEYFFSDWFPTTLTDYQYNKNGAMILDQNKGMTVGYNILNLPKLVTINNPVVDNGKIFYYYSADGIKRSVKHTWPLKTVLKPDILDPEEAVRGDEDEREKDEDGESPRGTNPIPMYTINSKTTDYVSNKIYINGQLDKILIPNGYIKDNIYYFYTRDHIGNNRVVMKQTSNNEVVQRTDYYPSGLPIPGGLNPEEQNRKYNDKEFDTMHGLNMFDYGARFYDPAIMRWHVPDPLAEKHYAWTPYAYVYNNPMNLIDPFGMDSTYFDSGGNHINTTANDPSSNDYFVVKTTQTTDEMYNGIRSDNPERGNSNPITQEQYNNTISELEYGNFIGDHMENVVAIPNPTAGKNILGVIGDDGGGGVLPANNREYATNVNSSTNETYNTVIGEVGDPSKGGTISVPMRMNHSHPSGTKDGYAWIQPPSNSDISCASPASVGINHNAWGMGSNILYIYNNSGVVATVKFKLVY